MSPTQLSLKWLRAEGYQADVVEKRIRAWITKDLFGGIDIVAMRRNEPLLAVQTTTSSHFQARLRKTNALRKVWMSTGNFFVVHGWLKSKRTGKWVLRVQ